MTRAGLARAAGLHANTLRDCTDDNWNPTNETLGKLERFLDANDDTPVLVPIEQIIDEARNGRMFVLVDDEDRENEGDLIIPAQMATPDAINFMAMHGRGLICLALARQRVDETDPARAHKTTARELYYAARAYAERNGLDDVLFLDTQGRLAEGSISSAFLVGGAEVSTPPLSSGALPGVLREELVERGLVRVRELREADLRAASAVLLGSSVRGLRRVLLQDESVDVG